MRSRLKVYACVTVLAAAFLLGAGGCSREDKPVGLVNEQVITRQDLNKFINLMRLYNPDLDDILQGKKDSSQRMHIDLEFLQMLVGIELVRQETERLSLTPASELVGDKTEMLLQELLQTHYSSSDQEFNRRLKLLRLNRDDISFIPLYEIQMQLYFDYITASITKEELWAFAEENPELLLQREGADVYRFSFLDELEAEKHLDNLREGTPVEEIISRIQVDLPEVEAVALGWLDQEDPFIEKVVKELLFEQPLDSPGGIIHQGNIFNLYWPREYRAAEILAFEDIIDEITLHKQYELYQDYFNTLWSKSEIEIMLD